VLIISVVMIKQELSVSFTEVGDNPSFISRSDEQCVSRWIHKMCLNLT